MKSLARRYKTNLALLTDLYQLTMAYGYWKQGRAEEQAVFHWFYRKNPFSANYVLVAGLSDCIEALESFHFSPEDIQYLGSLKGADGRALFEEAFLNYLQRMRFACTVSAVEEGTVVFPHEPLVRMEGPLLQVQLLETFLLNVLNFQSLIATKAALVCQAAQGDTVLEFGLRRAQGIDGGLSASRSAYIGGCHATSNVLAGQLYGIPVKGTHAHSWVMSFESEEEAFDAYREALPNNCVFLVDTYDTIAGVKKAIEQGHKLRAQGQKLLGIRLDSGDLAQLSKEARELLDQAGFEKTAIIASDSLNEDKIRALKAAGARIDVWGVGTELVTGSKQPALGGVYKLAALRKDAQSPWQYRIKLSENPIKVSNPGRLQLRRYTQSNGLPFGDAIYNIDDEQLQEKIACFDGREVVVQYRSYEDLLKPIFVDGKLIYTQPSLEAIRQRSLQQQAWFKEVDFSMYPQGLEPQLQALKLKLIAQYRPKD